MSEKYCLLWKNNTVAEFDTEKKYIDIKAPKLLPYEMKNIQGFDAIRIFASSRILQTNREYFKEILTSCNIEDQSDLNICIISKALSFRDDYWIKKADSNEKWENINLYHNPFSEEIAYTALTGETCSITIGNKVYTGELTNKGTRAKCFLRQNDKLYMLKAETDKEISSEIMSFYIADRLCIPSSKYIALNYAGKNCSVCKIETDEDNELIPCGNILKYFDCTMDANAKYYDFFYQKDHSGFVKMQLFDYITLNTDRNRDNFGLLRQNGIIKGLYPLFDHDSCFKGKNDTALYFPTHMTFRDSLEYLKDTYSDTYKIILPSLRNLYDYAVSDECNELFQRYGLEGEIDEMTSRIEKTLSFPSERTKKKNKDTIRHVLSDGESITDRTDDLEDTI